MAESTWSGYRILAEPHLRKPRLERETFSGGRNLSAIERNGKALADAKRVYVMHAERLIVVPKWFVDEFIERLKREIPDSPPKVETSGYRVTISATEAELREATAGWDTLVRQYQYQISRNIHQLVKAAELPPIIRGVF